MMSNKANYEKFPFIETGAGAGESAAGWDAILQRLQQAIDALPQGKRQIAFEVYPGVADEELLPQLTKLLGAAPLHTRKFMKPAPEIAAMVFPDVTDDEVFGFVTRLALKDFFSEEAPLTVSGSGIKAVYGPGATLLLPAADLIVYFDLPRWELQMRFRRGEASNLGLDNKGSKPTRQYKQGFYVDWRVCDEHKKKLMDRWDFIIDTTKAGEPKMITGALMNRTLAAATRQPFRVVPFFDPGPWGGQWMKSVCGLDPSAKNYAWCFDGVPEENSLLLKIGDFLFETPAMNLVLAEGKQLLGDAVQARFGNEFPIRFDFLDTIDGGNLSLQVHPTTEYARRHFGMDYTQDESYYILDATDDACVYLGLNDDTVPAEMISALKQSQETATSFDAEKYVGRWPVKKHDHVLIPAGTVHCSGKNSMVLEISATPFNFTFKLYDWGRMGLDGKPRPINIAHGEKVIDWSRKKEFTQKQLINTVSEVASGDGWREEKTGLHEREFIETRRHWFSKKVTHHTGGGVNVLNLVEGREALLTSPDDAFRPFVVHYAETFIVPAAVGAYCIEPTGESTGKTCGTMKAFIRTNP